MRWLRSHLTYPNLVTTAALVLAGSGLAVAASSGGGAVIHGCVSKRTGALRVIKPGAGGRAGRCVTGERPLSWNKQGPRGLPGKQGNQGNPGQRGQQGPGSVEYTWSLGPTSSQVLGPAGPFQFRAACSLSAGETVNEIDNTNSVTVNMNTTETTPPNPATITDESEPPEPSPVQFDVLALTSGNASRRADVTITSTLPTEPLLGELSYVMTTSANFCEGWMIWTPASG